MLKLRNITKDYTAGSSKVEALKGVSIDFRPSEFVAVLGQSGCGKTTLLNIIGGLDRYSSGDLIIRGKSTKKFKNRDWDTYRNHSIGFVFQSYNLIPHQTVLANVELALTLSGVSKSQRRQRAIDALAKVGLWDQLHKKPNQLSGGQMQRVAIARALVNDPEILLADEPTGALDSETSLQVMDSLKEVAKDRLVIMVTHNPELAEKYATRTVRLLDGKIISDSNPYTGGEPVPAGTTKKGKRTSMSAFTAFSLSLNNLMTKKMRTLTTAFAGSIGIVGIALILSLSTGINDYITDVEKDTLSSYPLQLESSTMDLSGMMDNMRPDNHSPQEEREENKIYSANVMSGMMNMMLSGSAENDLAAFKQYVDAGQSGLEALTSEIRYIYSTPLNIYKTDTSDGVFQINPNSVFEELGMGNRRGMDVWSRLTGNQELMETQYQVLAGSLPEKWNEVVLVVDENNQITDFTLYSLGLLELDTLQQALQDAMAGEDVTIDTTTHVYEYSDFLGLEFKVLPETDYYRKNADTGIWENASDDELFLAAQVQNAEAVKIVGVVRPGSDSSAGTSYGVIGYTGALMDHLIQTVADSAIVREQKANPDTDVLSALPFPDPNAEPEVYTMDELTAIIATLEPAQQAQYSATIEQMRQSGMSDDRIAQLLTPQFTGGVSDSTYEQVLSTLGVSDPEDPTAIYLYPIDFEAKDEIEAIIRAYNDGLAEEEQITYTDYIGLMMSSITTIINAISYILIAFVGISLVVSSIMIGIITNISVLERTKEIGILRAVGASKRDIRRVFTAETMIVGLAAGLVGIGLTELLIIPINAIIRAVTDISAEAFLDPTAAVILVAISVFLTYIAGLSPARSASRKDPVVALRTE